MRQAPYPKAGRILRALRLPGTDWLDLLRALPELARARWLLARIDARQFHEDQTRAGPDARMPEAAARIARISRAIPRAAALVPWRADCLVQAEAARHWLARHGIEARIRLGARHRADGGIDAHAWLLCNGGIVTGGDISGFTPFTTTRPRAQGQDRTTP